jgi:hypothetical protein
LCSLAKNQKHPNKRRPLLLLKRKKKNFSKKNKKNFKKSIDKQKQKRYNSIRKPNHPQKKGKKEK